MFSIGTGRTSGSIDWSHRGRAGDPRRREIARRSTTLKRVEWRERLTYPRPSRLIKDLAEIGVDPEGNLFALLVRHLGHGNAGLQLDGDINIMKDSGSAVRFGCGFVGGGVGHEDSREDMGLAEAGRAWRAV